MAPVAPSLGEGIKSSPFTQLDLGEKFDPNVLKLGNIGLLSLHNQSCHCPLMKRPPFINFFLPSFKGEEMGP